MMDVRQWQKLDLNLLRLFVVLSEEQNLTRAADRLHITPSAVSHALKRLRSQFADPLFIRQGQRMRPSPLCKRLAPTIQAHLDALYQSLSQTQTYDPADQPIHLRLAMPDALEHILLPPIFNRLNQEAPQLTLDSVAFRRTELEQGFVAGDIDFALDVARPIASPVLHEPVLTDWFCVLGWDTSTSPLTEDAYLSANHISVSSRPRGATVEDLALREAGYNRRSSVRCQSYHAAVAMVHSGYGVLTLPNRLARTLNSGSQLPVSALPMTLPPLITHLYCHQDSHSDQALSWAFNSIKNALSELE